MSDIDLGLAFDFIDPADGVARQLRFSRNLTPPEDPRVLDDTGQLIAVVVDVRRPDNGHTIPVSRPNVRFQDVETALHGWETWAVNGTDTVDLAAIRRRVRAAGLT
jgi:hypothetical protein